MLSDAINHRFAGVRTNRATLHHSAGALRAEKPELLTVILPQSLSKQPPESQELLQKASAPPTNPRQISSLRNHNHSHISTSMTPVARSTPPPHPRCKR